MMQQLILNIDDSKLETALNSIAQEEGREIIDVAMSALVYFVRQNSKKPMKNISTNFEKPALIDNNSLAYQMSLMACDPQIQRELENIENEFSITELDGLGKINGHHLYL